MLKFPDIQRLRRFRRILTVFFLLPVVCLQTLAQSGRHASNPQPSALPPAAPEQTRPPADVRPLTRAVSLIVARQPTSKHLLSEDAIAANFVKRLTEFTNVSTTYVGVLDRAGAVKRAKLESDKIVLLLQYDIDSFQNGTIILNSPDMDVKVIAFEPRTGKEKFKAKVYYKAVGGPMMKKDNWPNGTPIKITTEGVGVEAAEQVHDWLFVEELQRNDQAPGVVPPASTSTVRNLH